MAKAKKREEKAAEKDDYEFVVPDFDESAFIRREVQAAKASFWTLGLGFGAGILSVVLALAPVPWWTGWVVILAAIAGLRPLLENVGFSEDVIAPKALLGSYFMLFFTALAIWILGINFL